MAQTTQTIHEPATTRTGDVVEGLKRCLADTYLLYLRTHNYHWNVEGPLFYNLHELFEEQYQNLWKAVDPIAERVRMLGDKAPGSYGEMVEIASVPDVRADGLDDRAMVESLIEGHDQVLGVCNEVANLADDAKDWATNDLMTQRIESHEKMVWMLKSLLK